MTTEQNLKLKLTLGYILLIAIFSLSILYILREVKNLNVSKDDILVENTKVIQLGNIVSDLYATENSGRLALLSYDRREARNYHVQLDSLVYKIEQLKTNNIEDENLRKKLDTIVDLIKLKSLTFDQVLDVQSKYTNFDIYTEAQSKIKEIQKSGENTKIAIDTTVERSNFLQRVIKSFRNDEEVKKEKILNENNKIAQQQKNIQDSLSRATESVLSSAKKNELKLLKKYYEKEELLIDRNKELSAQLRNILAEVEKIILETSNSKYELSKNVIDKVSNNIAKIGIAISIIALFFGMIILRDLNKSARNKQKLEDLNKTMQELAQQKSFFMATISHDMVSPLNSLIGFSTLLQNTLKTAKQKEYLKNMVQSTRYIKSMVDDLSLFSNLEYNKIKIKKAKFNFSDLIKNVVNNLKDNANRKNISLTLEIDEQLNQNYNSDAYRIQQVLTNVVSNAVKFTHKGSVSIKAKAVGNKVAIEVVDTGIGIDIENKDDLFGAFVQAHDTNETMYGGSGLGLNITKRLIDLLYGRISFNSEIGKGTTFFIEFPLEVFKEKETNVIEEEYEYDNEKKLQNKKILVIDDDPLQLRLLEEIFGNKVAKITAIENGKLAKAILEEEQYDLIITDMQMPYYSGIKVIEDVRSLESYLHTPVIALTGKIDFDEHEYQKLGFNLYMQKPLNINNMYNVIYKMLRIKPKKNIVNNTQNTPSVYKGTYSDLTDLFELLENDKSAIKQIIDSFVTNATADTERLQKAFSEKDFTEVRNIAHKMLPMFRQLKMQKCIDLLIVLERSILEISESEIKSLIEQTVTAVGNSLEELKNTEF